jgi:hypothetical protein
MFGHELRSPLASILNSPCRFHVAIFHAISELSSTASNHGFIVDAARRKATRMRTGPSGST